MREEVKKRIEKELTLRTLATKNFDTFARYVKPDFIPGWFNHLLHDTVQQFVDDSINKLSPRLIITCPPRHGKTQAVSRSLGAFFPAYAPGNQAIFVTHTDRLAGDNGADTRAIIESAEYEKIFDCRLDPEHRSREDMRFLNGSKIKFTSIGAGLPGYGGEIIVVDDYFRNTEDANSQLIRDSTYDWLRGTLFNRIHPGGGIIITATRWHVDDPIGRLLEQFPDVWKVLEFPAIAKKDDEYRKLGEPLHPERWSLQQLNIARRDQGEKVFASLYQCSPYLETGNFFKADDILWYDELPKELNYCVGADYATSDKTSADHSAIVPAGIDHAENIYISDKYVYKRLDPRKAVEETVDLCKLFKTNVLCHEKGVIANTLRPIFASVCQEKRHYLVTERYCRRGGKALYANPVKALMEAKKIYFPRSRKEEISRLLLSFDPKADGEDDFVDALASICVIIDRAVLPPPLPELPQAEVKLTQREMMSNEAKRLYDEYKDSLDNDDSLDSW